MCVPEQRGNEETQPQAEPKGCQGGWLVFLLSPRAAVTHCFGSLLPGLCDQPRRYELFWCFPVRRRVLLLPGGASLDARTLVRGWSWQHPHPNPSTHWGSLQLLQVTRNCHRGNITNVDLRGSLRVTTSATLSSATTLPRLHEWPPLLLPLLHLSQKRPSL